MSYILVTQSQYFGGLFCFSFQDNATGDLWSPAGVYSLSLATVWLGPWSNDWDPGAKPSLLLPWPFHGTVRTEKAEEMCVQFLTLVQQASKKKIHQLLGILHW